MADLNRKNPRILNSSYTIVLVTSLPHMSSDACNTHILMHANTHTQTHTAQRQGNRDRELCWTDWMKQGHKQEKNHYRSNKMIEA